MGIATILRPLAYKPPAWRERQIVPGRPRSRGRFHCTRSRPVRCVFPRCGGRIRHHLPARTNFQTATDKEPQETSLRSTTNPENTPAKQYQPKPTNTTQNHITTTVLHFRLEHGLLVGSSELGHSWRSCLCLHSCSRTSSTRWARSPGSLGKRGSWASRATSLASRALSSVGASARLPVARQAGHPTPSSSSPVPVSARERAPGLRTSTGVLFLIGI